MHIDVIGPLANDSCISAIAEDGDLAIMMEAQSSAICHWHGNSAVDMYGTLHTYMHSINDPAIATRF